MFVSLVIVHVVLLIQILFYQKCFATKRMDSRVVGGNFTPIEEHPYCAFLAIRPYKRKGRAWSCGSSILNQRVLLTAAHCLEDCNRKNKCIIIVSVGHSNNEIGKSYSTRKFKVHEKYNTDTIENDIALIFTDQNIKLNDAVSKIILMKHPPYDEHAVVAGWGATNDILEHPSKWLKRLEQDIISTPACEEILRNVPTGTVCAGKFTMLNKGEAEYVAIGDSGSALVVRNIIQIGLVSYKNPVKSKKIVVYTDVGYFYDWIKKTAEREYCKYMKRSKMKGQENE